MYVYTRCSSELGSFTYVNMHIGEVGSKGHPWTVILFSLLHVAILHKAHYVLGEGAGFRQVSDGSTNCMSMQGVFFLARAVLIASKTRPGPVKDFGCLWYSAITGLV